MASMPTSLAPKQPVIKLVVQVLGLTLLKIEELVHGVEDCHYLQAHRAARNLFLAVETIIKEFRIVRLGVDHVHPNRLHFNFNGQVLVAPGTRR